MELGLAFFLILAYFLIRKTNNTPTATKAIIEMIKLLEPGPSDDDVVIQFVVVQFVNRAGAGAGAVPFVGRFCHHRSAGAIGSGFGSMHLYELTPHEY